MTIKKCKDCGLVISSTDIQEWNAIPDKEKARSSGQSIANNQCQRCFNENKGRHIRE